MTDREHVHHDSSIVETLQSLIVAFVLAMTFRGFVAEGFVIPTGSMAPTLMGAHQLLHSEMTGYTWPVGLDEQLRMPEMRVDPVDPMLGPNYFGGGIRPAQRMPRSGDRILVLKTIYPFVEAKRWDVVVFKNPTDPKGEAGNYIKRLIGLPGETILLADGDVFAMPPGGDRFQIQRKPDYIQRALWQPLHSSDFALANPHRLDVYYPGPPWRSDEWDTSGRSYRTDTSTPTVLEWDTAVRDIDDWSMYNMLDRRWRPEDPSGYLVSVSDIRVAAGVVAERGGLATALELEARNHVFEFFIEPRADGGSGHLAGVRYRLADEPDAWIEESSQPVRLPDPGRVFNVEFWHVDQSMRLFIDGREAARLDYDWSPVERMQWATGLTDDRAISASYRGAALRQRLRWRFEGSPVTLHRVRTDRDVHYRTGPLDPRHQRNEPRFTGEGSGTHVNNPAELGPDHYFMLGDNSQASLDSRFWGSPHRLVIAQIGDNSPFVVHRKLLLGKAWVVYFPAPYAITEGGVSIVPDFGRLRYIR
jgi:signal peptidase I